MKKDSKKKSDSFRFLDGWLFARMLRGGAERLSDKADTVNNLNVFPVPDGDTGDNMTMTIEGGVAALEGVDSGNLGEVSQAMSKGMLLGARGNSGVILSQFFAGVGRGLATCDKADVSTIGQALTEGVKQAYASVLTPMEGTILTVAREAVDYAVSRITPKSTIKTLFADLEKEMKASLARTPDLLAALKEAGVIDSGGAGLLYIVEGFNKILKGEEVKAERRKTKSKAKTVSGYGSFGPDSVMEYGYCTELLLQLQHSKVSVADFDIQPLTAFLQEVGDSIVAFKSDSIVKVHVHTMTPEKVLAFCRQYGEFLNVKIENMSVQHSETAEEVPAAEAPKVPEKPVTPQKPRKKYGAIAVANGAGIEQIFKDLGVDVIVHGGQTHNPSIQDFLDAFEQVAAEHIFVFPNNSNILLAAQQAAELYQEDQFNPVAVYIIPSKDLGNGYVALASMDVSVENPMELKKQLEAAMTHVQTGLVSPAVRDAQLNGVEIHNGDFIGFVGKEMLVSEASEAEAACGLLKHMLENGTCYVVTAFVGQGVDPAASAAVETYMQTNHPTVELYLTDGGQDVYPFIFVAE